MRRWLKRISLFIAAAFLVLIFGVLPYFLAGAFTVRKFQMPDKANEGLTPASFQLPFEDVNFPARDGVPLAGWWVPAPEAKGTVVLVHGLNRSRLENATKLPFLNRSGWNALLFDLRRHGQSGGTLRSLGFHERQDVLGALDFCITRAHGPVVAWGISFGAASALLAAAEEPRLAGVIADSSFRSLRDTARHHLALFRGFRWYLKLVPAWPTADITVYWMGKRGEFDPDALDVVAAARKLGDRPVLFVASAGDERMPAAIAQELKAAAGPQAKALLIESSGHGHAYRDGTGVYEAAVAEVLSEVVQRSRAHE